MRPNDTQVLQDVKEAGNARKSVCFDAITVKHDLHKMNSEESNVK